MSIMDFIKKDKAYFFEIRTTEGSIGECFSAPGKDFMPSAPEYEWPTFRIIGENKNECIEKMIEKLQELKE